MKDSFSALAEKGHTTCVHSPEKLPLSDVIHISSENGSTAIITASGQIYVSGDNFYGQLGLGDTVNRYTLTELKFNF